MKNDKGFTLLEIVIAIFLSVVVLLAGSQLIFFGIKSWMHGEEQIDVVQNMRAAMDFMTKTSELHLKSNRQQQQY